MINRKIPMPFFILKEIAVRPAKVF